MEIQRGCVYFFKHVGLSPIKIGYSQNESPIKRFEQFKTYAPFGAMLIGFIRTERAKELETELHQKYARDRVKGEWFEISEEEVNKCIKFYSNLQDIEEINNFQIAFAKKINFDKRIILFKILSIEKTLNHSKEIILNQQEVSELTGYSKEEVKKTLKENLISMKPYRIGDKIKKGYKFYM